jgi:acyl-CoA synthetase (AMP-forming)/AMP-acid ligase II
VEAAALLTPHAIAIVDGERPPLTYADVVNDAVLIGGWLVALLLTTYYLLLTTYYLLLTVLIGGWLVASHAKPGVAVGVFMGHCAELLLVQLGVAMSAAACFNLETHFGPAMISELLAQTDPIALVTSDKLAPRLEQASRT